MRGVWPVPQNKIFQKDNSLNNEETQAVERFVLDVDNMWKLPTLNMVDIFVVILFLTIICMRFFGGAIVCVCMTRI